MIFSFKILYDDKFELLRNKQDQTRISLKKKRKKSKVN